jgi:hypothetical protein
MIRMRWPSSWRARALVFVVVLASLAVPSVALGFWSGGTSTATTSFKLAQPLALVLSPATAGPDLSPGESGGVHLVVSNPNPIVVHVGSFVADGDTPISVDAAHSGCDVSALTFTTQTNGTVGWDVPPAVGATDGTLTVDLVGSLAMSDSAANACQGAQFSVPLDVGL